MKTLYYTQYGQPDVLQFRDIPRPEPKANELLVRVTFTSVNRTDSATIRGIPFIAKLFTGLFGPRKKTPGSEFAGVVEAVGPAVEGFKPGIRVFGFGDMGSSSHAEYLCVKETNVLALSVGLSEAHAAAGTEGFHYALNNINKSPLVAGQKALVYGATGAIGSAGVQILKSMGLWVTAVGNTRNQEMLKSLGADKVVDYEQEDFTADDLRYDVILDAVGKVSFFKCFRLLNRGGFYISSDLGYLNQNVFLPMITPLISPLLGGRRTRFPFPVNIKGSLLLIEKLAAEGRYKPVLDREFPFDDIIEAYRYVQTGQKTGNVLIRMVPEKSPERV